MNNFKNNRIGYTLITITLLASVITIFSLPPIAQITSYHTFSDQRTILNISNFYNVLSNLPFLIVGLYGLYSLLISRKLYCADEFKIAYILFFTGVTLVSAGSVYYHLMPDNQTLIWDRIPIAITIMALLSIVISEFISLRIARWLLFPLIITGILSVYYWQLSESSGTGDLRAYILVQALAALLTTVIILNFKSKYTSSMGYWWVLISYALSKFLEYFDEEIHLFTGFISGHSLKHIIIAAGVYLLIVYYKNRQYKQQSEN
ncbi:hypothetical protein MNBD_GAMMA11-2855 [hydrothermal vent metagenome]|uniref:Alkaline phytoceramidase n=1 Tax=hydrothermal vent metagenome TaxID=652676 RepID=A0A3B0XUL6_9ZZZZ